MADMEAVSELLRRQEELNDLVRALRAEGHSIQLDTWQTPEGSPQLSVGVTVFSRPRGGPAAPTPVEQVDAVDAALGAMLPHVEVVHGWSDVLVRWAPTAGQALRACVAKAVVAYLGDSVPVPNALAERLLLVLERDSDALVTTQGQGVSRDLRAAMGKPPRG